MADQIPVTHPTAEPTVTIAGQNVADGETLTLTYDEYTALKGNPAPVVVNPATGNKISVSGATTGFVNETVRTSLELGAAGDEVTLTVQSLGNKAGEVTGTYTYSVTWTAADDDTNLYYNDEAITSPYRYEGGATTLDNMEDLFTVAPNSDVVWTHFDGNDNVISTQSTSIQDDYYSIATVEAENGDTAQYVIYFAADADDIGLVDSAADLGAALADAAAGTATTIRLAPGTYELEQKYTATGDLTIIAMGEDVVIESDFSGRTLEVHDGIELTVKGVTFKSTYTGTDLTIGIKQSGEAGSDYTFDISDCTFIGFSTSIQLFHTAGGSITNCTFDSKLVDISLSDLSGMVTISGNTYSENNTDPHIGISLADKDMVTILDEDVVVDYPA